MRSLGWVYDGCRVEFTVIGYCEFLWFGFAASWWVCVGGGLYIWALLRFCCGRVLRIVSLVRLVLC